MTIPQSSIAEQEARAPFPVRECPSLLHLMYRAVRERPEAPIFLWADHGTDYKPMSASGFWRRTDQVYSYLKSGVCADLPPGSRVMLLHDNYREALLLLWAFWKADYKVMLVANRNSAAGFAELKRTGEIDVVFTTEKLASKLGDLPHRLIPVKFELPSVTSETRPLECRPPRPNEVQETPICLHTSGSTAYPKPVWLTNYYNLEIVAGLPPTDFTRSDPRRCLTLAPLYHALGFFSQVALPASGVVTCVMPPGDTFPPKPSLTMEALAKLDVTFLSCAPALLESLVAAAIEDPTSACKKTLQDIPVIAYGGAHMPRGMLDKLRDFGLHVGSGYGSTEIGIVLEGAHLPDEPQAMRLKPMRENHVKFVPLEDEPNLFRLVLKSEFLGAQGATVAQKDGFDTGDLFAKGPVEGTWIFSSRCDDVVVQVNGEKTNALGIELAVLAADPSLINACMVFGQQKPAVGILIEVKEAVARTLSPMDILARVREAVAVANAESPTQSRILEKMIWILPFDKQLPMTPKLSLKRRDALEMYSDAIERLYSKSELVSDASKALERLNTREIVTAALKEVMGENEVQPDVSLFDQGLNSQKSITLLSALRSRLPTKLKPETLYELSTVDALASFLQRESAESETDSEAYTSEGTADELASMMSQVLNLPKDGLLTALYETNLFDLGLTSQLAIQVRSEMQSNFHKKLPSNLLYENPTLKDLVAWLSHRVPAAISATVDPLNTRGTLDVLNKCYDRLDQIELGLPAFQSEDHRTDERVYLLTGSSGALGGQILVKLASLPTTKKIYCPIRMGGREKLVKALADHRLDTSVITREDSIVHCVPFETKDKFLGMEIELYRKVRREVTDVIHSAWKMDFNQRVQDFAPDCLESLLNLVHFCCVSDNVQLSPDGTSLKGFKKRIYFISSVSAVAGYAAVLNSSRTPTESIAVKPSSESEGSSGKDESNSTLASNAPETCVEIPEQFMGREQLHMAVPMGYGQSKFIAEAICDRASKQLQLSAYVIRCGQLSGDSQTGAWNTKELVSLLSVAGACDLGVLPDITLSSEFVPMDVSGAAVVDIVQAAATDRRLVYHIANPHGGTWRDWASALKEAGIRFRLVSSPEFGKQLALHSDNRCQVLASFLEKILREPDQSVVTRMDTSRTCDVSANLRKCPPVDGKLAKVYLDYWRSVGFLKSQ